MDSLQPIRIELRTSSSWCTFTVHLSFVTGPNSGDYIIFNYNNDKSLSTKVLGFCHYFPDYWNIVITEPLMFDSQDVMLNALDWFKVNYDVCDVKSDDEPEPHYIFYRSLLHLLGRSKELDPYLDVDQHSMKVFAEACRSILVAEFFGEHIYSTPQQALLSCANNFNIPISDLYSLVLSKKQNNDKLKIAELIKTWEPIINKSKTLKWASSVDSHKFAAKMIFGRINSLPADMIPNFD